MLDINVDIIFAFWRQQTNYYHRWIISCTLHCFKFRFFWAGKWKFHHQGPNQKNTMDGLGALSIGTSLVRRPLWHPLTPKMMASGGRDPVFLSADIVTLRPCWRVTSWNHGNQSMICQKQPAGQLNDKDHLDKVKERSKHPVSLFYTDINHWRILFHVFSIKYMVLENGRPETFPKSTRSNSLPVRKVRWPISILAQGWTASWCIESWWIYKMRGNLIDELTSVPGRSPHDGIHSRKVPTSKAVERLFIIPRELAVPSGTTAMLGDFMLEEKGQWIDWVRNKLTYFNHVGQQKHPTKFVWESQFEVAMRGAALHRFQPSCQGEESLSPCSSLQRNSTPSSPKVFVDLHAGRFSPRNAHQSVEWMQLFRKTTENACKIC